MNLAKRVHQLNDLVAAFRYEVAHDTFYAPDLIKHENENAPTVGLPQHRREMKHFLIKISNASAVPLHTIVSDEMSVTEWHYRFDHLDWGPRDFKQLSIQRWKAGKITHERHHYKTDRW